MEVRRRCVFARDFRWKSASYVFCGNGNGRRKINGPWVRRSGEATKRVKVMMKKKQQKKKTKKKVRSKISPRKRWGTHGNPLFWGSKNHHFSMLGHDEVWHSGMVSKRWTPRCQKLQSSLGTCFCFLWSFLAQKQERWENGVIMKPPFKKNRVWDSTQWWFSIFD